MSILGSYVNWVIRTKVGGGLYRYASGAHNEKYRHSSCEIWHVLFGVTNVALCIIALFSFAVIMHQLGFSQATQSDIHSVPLLMMSAIMTYVPLILVIIDHYLGYLIKRVTDGDVHDYSVLGNFVFGSQYSEAEGYHSKMWVLVVALSLPVWLVTLAVALPTTLQLIAGGILGLMVVQACVVKLLRLVYRLNKKLKNHIGDPKAHKEQ